MVSGLHEREIFSWVLSMEIDLGAPKETAKTVFTLKQSSSLGAAKSRATTLWATEHGSLSKLGRAARA